MAFAGAGVDRARDDLYVIARDPAGELRGFLHFGVVPGGRALSLSSMRRERDTPNGLNEFLICRALEHARAHGIERVSLNFAAFALLLDPPAPLDPLSRAERRVLARLARQVPAGAAALVQPEVRAAVDAALRRLSERRHASAHRPRGHARGGLRDPALGALAGAAHVSRRSSSGSASRWHRRSRWTSASCCSSARPGARLPSRCAGRAHPRGRCSPDARWLAGFCLGPARLGPVLRRADAGAALARADRRRQRPRPARRASSRSPVAALPAAARTGRRAARHAGADGARRQHRRLPECASRAARPRPAALAALGAAVLGVVALALRGRSAAIGGLAAGLCYGTGDVTSKAMLIGLPHHPTPAALLASPLLYATRGRARARLRRAPARVPARRRARLARADDGGDESPADRGRRAPARRAASRRRPGAGPARSARSPLPSRAPGCSPGATSPPLARRRRLLRLRPSPVAESPDDAGQARTEAARDPRRRRRRPRRLSARDHRHAQARRPGGRRAPPRTARARSRTCAPSHPTWPSSTSACRASPGPTSRARCVRAIRTRAS